MSTNLIKVGVQIMPREVILDTQGRAVENSLKMHGYEISSCRVGKFLELSFSNVTSEVARKKAEQMVKEAGLYNPLIEQFSIREI